jgi:branched-chain amino acid transport system substrate-binding protein
MNRTTLKRTFAVMLAAGVLAAGCSRTDSTSTGSPTGTGATGGSTPAGGSASGPFIDPAADCKDYKGTAGISGDTIKIGTIRPASGPYAIYDQVTAGMEAYFKAKNAAGGIKAGDGKSYKVELIKGDDGYDPGKTLGEAKKLVEQEGVFALAGVIGTEGNLAIRQYMNDGCIPNVSLATGSPEWGAADKYPWYMSALASYATEAHGWAQLLKQQKPEAKVALLYQDDDFGKSYQSAFKKAIEGTKITVVKEQSFNPLSGGTTEAAVTSLSQSGADTFIVGIGGTPCPQTLKFMPDTWKPMTFISITCQSKIALSLAGGKDIGVYSAQVTYDASDPADKDNPKVKAFVTEGKAGGLSDSQIEGGISSAGWGFAALFAKSLEDSKTVDRASVMNTLFSLKNTTFGLLREGVTVNTNGATDPWPVEGFRMVQRTADGWKEIVPVTNYEGQSNSFAAKG